MTLAQRLKTVREERGLNLTHAAQGLEVARTAYRLWEKDAAAPSPEHWKKIAVWCDVPLATILRDLGFIDADEEQVLLKLAAKRMKSTR